MTSTALPGEDKTNEWIIIFLLSGLNLRANIRDGTVGGKRSPCPPPLLFASTRSLQHPDVFPGERRNNPHDKGTHRNRGIAGTASLHCERLNGLSTNAEYT